MKYNLLNNLEISSDSILMPNELIHDLKLELLLDAMSSSEGDLREICRNIILSPLNNKEEIQLRQTVLKDAISHRELFSHLYELSSETLEKISGYDALTKPQYEYLIPISKKIITHNEITEIYINYLENLREELLTVTDLSSVTFSNFIKEFTKKYSKEFIREARQQIEKLKTFKENTSIVIGGHYGNGMKLAEVELHEVLNKNNLPKQIRQPLFFQLTKNNSIPLSNNTLINNAKEMTDAGLYWILKMLTDFNKEIRLVLMECRRQFGFYTGAVNLYQFLEKSERVSICYPEVSDIHVQNTESLLNFQELVDIGLILKGEATVSNSISTSNKLLWIITGANQGGKTTYLRSIGIAQLMAQAGLFVAAKEYSCCVYAGIFSHFPDEEDEILQSGLLEKELKKMDSIIRHLQPNSMLLLNESFATTTEYDACYLADEIINGFLCCNITTIFVTHNYKYASELYKKNREDILFLRAGRTGDGVRNYCISEGKPLKSSHAMDLYEQIIVD